MFLLHGLCIYHLCLTHISDAQKIYSPYLFICSKHKTNIYIYILKTQIQKYYLDVHYIYIYICATVHPCFKIPRSYVLPSCIVHRKDEPKRGQEVHLPGVGHLNNIYGACWNSNFTTISKWFMISSFGPNCHRGTSNAREVSPESCTPLWRICSPAIQAIYWGRPYRRHWSWDQNWQDVCMTSLVEYMCWLAHISKKWLAWSRCTSSKPQTNLNLSFEDMFNYRHVYCMFFPRSFSPNRWAI